MLGFLLVRQVGQSLDELAALVSVYSSPRELRAARRTRRSEQVVDDKEVQHLLAPWWLPYRHGLDFVSDLAAAATNQAADVAERRRAVKLAETGAAPPRVVDEDDDEAVFAQDSGLLVRFFTSPVALSVSLFVLLALIGAREAFGAVAGGALSPVPATAGDWWSLHVESWHPLGQGTPVPAPGVRAAAGARRDPPRRQPRGRDVGAAGARRAVLAVGSLALPAGGRPARRPPRLRAAAASRGAR